MTKILVTGSSGLIGRQITKDLVEKNFDVYSCYNLEKPEFGIITHLDLSKNEKIIEVVHTVKPDVVIHLAAITDVELCEKQKELANLINTKSTKILAQESKKQNSFFVYISTDYVFDGIKGMKNEEDKPNPLNFYGKSKLEGEIILNNLSLPHAVVRTSTPFGIHQKKKSFPLWVKENLESQKEIPVLVDQFTSPTHISNLSEMIIEVATKEISELIHLAGATRISRYEFAKIIANKLNLNEDLLKPLKMNETQWIAQRPMDSSLDISKANKILDNKPQQIERSLEFFIKKLQSSLL